MSQVALNVVVGLALFIILNFLEWDGMLLYIGERASCIGTSYRRDSDGVAEGLRWAILALSAVLSYQIYDRQVLFPPPLSMGNMWVEVGVGASVVWYGSRAKGPSQTSILGLERRSMKQTKGRGREAKGKKRKKQRS